MPSTTSPAPPPDVWTLDVFELLGHMARAYRRGEPPGLLNPHMTALLPYRGERSGPGWPEPTEDEGSVAALAATFKTDEGELLDARGARRLAPADDAPVCGYRRRSTRSSAVTECAQRIPSCCRGGCAGGYCPTGADPA